MRLPRQDVGLAVALAVVAEIDVLIGSEWRGPTWVNAIVVPATALALAWRRTRPLASFAVVAAGLVFLALAFGGSETWAGTFIFVVAVYSVAAHGTEVLAAGALVASVVAVETLTDPLIHGFGDWAWAATVAVLTFLVGLGSRARQARTDALEREQDERAVAAVDEERRRIARELHDVVSHSLGIVVLQAGAAEQILDTDPARAREVLESIRSTGQEALGEMDTLLGLVRSGVEHSLEPQPSLGDLDALVRKMREAGMAVELVVEGTPRALPATLELSAFRIVQEGLTNAAKHAGSAPARVILRYRDTELEVEVVDEGAGSPSGRGGRRGLAGIGERVAVFGGRLEVGPGSDGGWRLRAAFPLSQ